MSTIPTSLTEKQFDEHVQPYIALLVRFDRKDAFFLGAHLIAFAMMNLRHVVHS